jgi:hypothetical protein
LAALDTAEALATADTEYERDFRAASSAAPSDSLLKTWTELHVKRLGKEVPVLPLTPDKIHKVGSLLKAGGYRSAANYFSRIKDAHVESLAPWTEALSQAIHKATQSTTRGMGPSRQTSDLDLVEVSNLELSDEPLVEGGPVGPRELAVVSSLFCEREIESSLGLETHYELDEIKEELTVLLPTSKRDPKALGTRRTWGCTCVALDEEDALSSPCAYHSWVLHRENLVSRFGNDEGELPEGLRAFPGADGRVVPKEKIVQTAEQLALLTNREISGPGGERLFGGHVWRITGARHLASINIAIWLIMLIARWAGKTVMRYVAEAPLKKVTLEYRTRYLESRNQDTLLELKSSIQNLRSRLEEMEASPATSSSASSSTEEILEFPRFRARHLLRMDSNDEFRLRTARKRAADGIPIPQVGQENSQDLETLKRRIEEIAATSTSSAAHSSLEANVDRMAEELRGAQVRLKATSFPEIITSAYNVAHRPTVAGLLLKPRDWKCACGWEFGCSEYSAAVELPRLSKDICSTCFPLEKRRKRQDENPVGVTGDSSDEDDQSGAEGR